MRARCSLALVLLAAACDELPVVSAEDAGLDGATVTATDGAVGDGKIHPDASKIKDASTANDGSSSGSVDGAIDAAMQAGFDAAVEDTHFVPACGVPGAQLVDRGTVTLPGRAMALAWSPAGDALAVSGYFKAPSPAPRYDWKVYDAQSGAFVKEFGCPDYWATSVNWTQNATLGEVIGGGNYGHSLFYFNAQAGGTTKCPSVPQFLVADGAVKAFPNINDAVTWTEFSPDGTLLAAIDRGPVLRLWKIDAGTNQYKVVKVWYSNLFGQGTSLGWSPDGKNLTATESTGTNAGRVYVLPFNRATDLWTDQSVIDTFNNLGFANQPSWIGNNPQLVALVPAWSDTGRAYWRARFSPSGALVAGVAMDGTLSVYAASSGQVVQRVSVPDGAGIFAMDWSPDGGFVAVGTYNKNVYVYETSGWKLVQTLTAHTAPLSAIAWSPDGCALATTAGGPRICGLQYDGTECHDCSGDPNQTPTCPAFSDLRVKIWRWGN